MISGFITWDVSPEIFKLGAISVRWYGVLFAFAFVMAYFLMKKMFTKENVPISYLEKLTLYVFVGVLAGARLGHCLFYDPIFYLTHPIEMLLPIANTASEGWKFVGYQGLASHGGAIGILTAVWFYSKKTKLTYLWTLDRLVIAVALAGASIRFGNLMNSEIYGLETSLPWGFIFVRDGQTVAHHPTQLYEGLSCVLISLGLYLYYNKEKMNPKPGIIFGIFLITLFSVRFVLEFLKENQEPWEDGMALNMGQILSVPFVLIGIVVVYLSIKGKLGMPLDIAKLKLEDKNKKK